MTDIEHPTLQKISVVSSTDLQKVKKTRYRVPTVCSVCRRRKMKCDKAKPFCTSCLKNNTTHLCIYEEQPWANGNEVQKLKDQIAILQEQNSELQKLISKKSISEAQSKDTIPGSHAHLHDMLPNDDSPDPILDLSNEFDLLMMKEAKIGHYGSTSYMSIIANDPMLKEIFKDLLNTESWGVNFSKFFLYDQGIIPDAGFTTCGLASEDDKPGVFENNTIFADSGELIRKINSILPKKDIIYALINHFFSEAYAFVPFIDEVSFRINMDSLITSDLEGNTTLVVGSLPVLTTVAVLLCVLRFSYLCLPPKQSEEASKNLNVFKIFNSNVMITPNFIEYSKACMSSASVLRKPTLKHIQALLLLRMYRYYAPEDPDESADSTIFLALIVQMAKMHGLHRDPSNFTVIKDDSTANIWRKIWAQLMYLDSIQAFNFGCPLLIDDEYDTKLPQITSRESYLEKTCIEALIKQHEVTLLRRRVINVCSKVKSQPKRSDIERRLREIEIALRSYTQMDELISPSPPNENLLTTISKVHNLMAKIGLYLLLASTYHIMFLTSKNHELGLQLRYLSGSAEASYILFYVYHRYVSNPYSFPGGLKFSIFTSAKIFEVARRISLMTSSFALRGLSSLMDLSKVVRGFESQDGAVLKQWLSSQVEDLSTGEIAILRSQEFAKSCENLSKTYFSGWRLVQMNIFFVELIELQFPGKLEEINSKLDNYNSQKNSENLLFGNTFSDVITGLGIGNSSNHELWSSFVDVSNQSTFDYLSPDFSRLENFNDPFISNRDAIDASELFNFQNLNSAMTVGGPFSTGTFTESRKTSSSSDNVSSKTDERDNSFPLSLENLDYGVKDPKFTPGLESFLDGDDVALEIARTMFGGADNLQSEYNSRNMF